VVAIRVTSETSNPALFIRNPFTVTFSALSIGASETASAALAGNVNPIIGPQ
jgi:hypothetical protein